MAANFSGRKRASPFDEARDESRCVRFYLSSDITPGFHPFLYVIDIKKRLHKRVMERKWVRRCGGIECWRYSMLKETVHLFFSVSYRKYRRESQSQFPFQRTFVIWNLRDLQFRLQFHFCERKSHLIMKIAAFISLSVSPFLARYKWVIEKLNFDVVYFTSSFSCVDWMLHSLSLSGWQLVLSSNVTFLLESFFLSFLW